MIFFFLLSKSEFCWGWFEPKPQATSRHSRINYASRGSTSQALFSLLRLLSRWPRGKDGVRLQNRPRVCPHEASGPRLQALAGAEGRAERADACPAHGRGARSVAGGSLCPVVPGTVPLANASGRLGKVRLPEVMGAGEGKPQKVLAAFPRPPAQPPRGRIWGARGQDRP